MKALTAKRFAHLPEIEAHEIGRPHFKLRNALVAGLGDFGVYPLWDLYAVAASTACIAQDLFQNAAGQQQTITGGATFIKTRQTTSMKTAGKLPAPERFLARGISVFLDNTMNQIDVAKFLSQTYLKFTIGEKPAIEVPHLAKLPAGGGAYAAQITTAAATTLSVAGNGMPFERQGFHLTAPGANGSSPSESFPDIEGVLLAQDQVFDVLLDPTLAAHIAAVGFTTQAGGAVPAGIGVFAWVYLEGTRVRAVQ